jgi:hypothetical protein
MGVTPDRSRDSLLPAPSGNDILNGTPLHRLTYGNYCGRTGRALPHQRLTPETAVRGSGDHPSRG